MTRSQTIDVLNDAYDVQRRLDWVLFTNDNENYGSESDWVPGDPIYNRPCSCGGCEEQYIRPMIQEIDIDRFHNNDAISFRARCTNCEVYWDNDDPCFVCGQVVEHWKPAFVADLLLRDMQNQMRSYLQRTTQNLFEGYARADAEFTRRVYFQAARPWRIFIDEWTEDFETIEPYQPPAPRRFSLRDILDRRVEFTGVRLTSLDDLRDALSRELNVRVPIAIRRLCSSDFVPHIEPPKFDVSEQWWGWGGPAYRDPQPFPTSTNPTRQRRPRRA